MKRLLTSLLAAFGMTAYADTPKSEPAEVIVKMRAMVLAIKPSDIGLKPADYAGRPWGLLMETGLQSGAVYSLAVLADGTTSLYFSNGGGIIGAGEQPTVRIVSKSMLETAAKHQGEMKPTTTTPFPQSGKVQFYLLTSSGTLAYSADEQKLGNNQDQLSELFHAGHAVITQVRLAEEARRRNGASDA